MKTLLLLSLLSFTVSRLDKPTHRTVEMGTYRLHTVTQGSGSPLVVFEAGMGEDYSTWQKVLPRVSSRTRVFAYDRAGLGSSTPTSTHRDAGQLARELHQVLQKSAERKPYILVGHSLGAWIVMVFAARYPKEVAGLVLVDPAFPESRLKQALPDTVWTAREQTIARYTGAMPAAILQEKAFLETSAIQAAQAYPKPNVPVVLLTGTKFNPDFPGAATEQQVKLQTHREWLAHVPGSEHVLVDNSRHYIQNEAPDELVAAIERVLKRTQSRH